MGKCYFVGKSILLWVLLFVDKWGSWVKDNPTVGLLFKQFYLKTSSEYCYYFVLPTFDETRPPSKKEEDGDAIPVRADTCSSCRSNVACGCAILFCPDVERQVYVTGLMSIVAHRTRRCFRI